MAEESAKAKAVAVNAEICGRINQWNTILPK